MRPLLAYYKDKQGKQPLDILTFEGEPPVVGRDQVRSTIWVRNEHEYPMELKPITADPDLKVTKYPKYLEPDKIGEVELTFFPSKDRIKPLSGTAFDFVKIVYEERSD